MIGLFRPLLFRPSLPGYYDFIGGQIDLDIIFLQAGKGGRQDELLFGFFQVDIRNKLRS